MEKKDNWNTGLDRKRIIVYKSSLNKVSINENQSVGFISFSDTSDIENKEYESLIKEVKELYEANEADRLKVCKEYRRGKYIYIFIQSDISRSFERLVFKGYISPSEAEEFYRDNSALIEHVAKKYTYLYQNDKLEQRSYICDDLDIYEACAVGFAKAVNTYKKDKVKFSTYAYACMDKECKEFARELLKERRGYNLNIISGDCLTNPDNEASDSFFSCMPDEKSTIDYGNVELKEMIKQSLTLLTEREQDIINDYYGFEGHSSLTQIEIARKYGLSQPRIKGIMNEAMEKIKKNLKTHGITDISSVITL